MDNERPTRENDNTLRKGCEEPVVRERRGVEERPMRQEPPAPQKEGTTAESKQ